MVIGPWMFMAVSIVDTVVPVMLLIPSFSMASLNSPVSRKPLPSLSIACRFSPLLKQLTCVALLHLLTSVKVKRSGGSWKDVEKNIMLHTPDVAEVRCQRVSLILMEVKLQS